MAAGVIRRAKDGVRVLGGEGLTAPLTLDVPGAARPPQAAIEKAGGTVTVAVKRPEAAADVAA